jgi:hypothetical protein
MAEIKGYHDTPLEVYTVLRFGGQIWAKSLPLYMVKFVVS